MSNMATSHGTNQLQCDLLSVFQFFRSCFDDGSRDQKFRPIVSQDLGLALESIHKYEIPFNLAHSVIDLGEKYHGFDVGVTILIQHQLATSAGREESWQLKIFEANKPSHVIVDQQIETKDYEACQQFINEARDALKVPIMGTYVVSF